MDIHPTHFMSTAKGKKGLSVLATFSVSIVGKAQGGFDFISNDFIYFQMSSSHRSAAKHTWSYANASYC